MNPCNLTIFPNSFPRPDGMAKKIKVVPLASALTVFAYFVAISTIKPGLCSTTTANKQFAGKVESNFMGACYILLRNDFDQ